MSTEHEIATLRMRIETLERIVNAPHASPLRSDPGIQAPKEARVPVRLLEAERRHY